MRGLKRDHTARVIVAGHAFVQNLRRGFYDLGTDVPSVSRLADAFAELALVIRHLPMRIRTPRPGLSQRNSAARRYWPVRTELARPLGRRELQARFPMRCGAADPSSFFHEADPASDQVGCPAHEYELNTWSR
jgi:hypothetical protein